MWMDHFNGKIDNAHAPCPWPGGRGHPKPHIWNQRPQFAYHYITFMGLQRLLRGVYMGAPHCKAVLGWKLSPINSGHKNSAFRELRDVNVKFLFSDPQKAHPCAELRRLTYYACKSVQGPGLWAVGRTRKKEAE